MVKIAFSYSIFLSKNTGNLFPHTQLSDEIEEETIGEYRQGQKFFNQDQNLFCKLF